MSVQWIFLLGGLIRPTPYLPPPECASHSSPNPSVRGVCGPLASPPHPNPSVARCLWTTRAPHPNPHPSVRGVCGPLAAPNAAHSAFWASLPPWPNGVVPFVVVAFRATKEGPLHPHKTLPFLYIFKMFKFLGDAQIPGGCQIRVGLQSCSTILG